MAQPAAAAGTDETGTIDFPDTEGFAELERVATGTALAVEGELVESPGKGQRWELKARRMTIVGECSEDFPLQKKRHSDLLLMCYQISLLRVATTKSQILQAMKKCLQQAVKLKF